MSKIKVLIIDDSALVRKMLSIILNSDRAIEVVGIAADPLIARERIKELNPDVLTLDVEMPKMDGITFLKNLMRLRPMPVVMVSTLTEAGAEITLDALELGAIDYIHKPKVDFMNTIDDYADELIEKVKVAAKARVECHFGRRNQDKVVKKLKVKRRNTADVILQLNKGKRHHTLSDTIIAIGASTGGTEAIREILEVMPVDSPGLVITQHIPINFSASFAKRMDNISPMKVCEVADGQQILPGHAPGEAVKRDAAEHVLAPSKIAYRLISVCAAMAA